MQKSRKPFLNVRKLGANLGYIDIMFWVALAILAVASGLAVLTFLQLFLQVDKRLFVIKSQTNAQTWLLQGEPRSGWFRCQKTVWVLSEYSYQEIDPENLSENVINCRDRNNE